MPRCLAQPMRRACALLLVVGVVYLDRGLAMDLPPIDWSGRIGLLLRTSQPENGDDIFQQSYTGELIGRSIVWQPWFGNWRARMAASKSLTHSNTDQDATIFSGDGQLNLFPVSRFPFQAFFDVQDTRVDISDTDRPGFDNRFYRVGLRQRYQSPGGDIYNATVLRDEREDLITGRTDTSNRAILSGLLQRGFHRINGSFLANDTQTDGGDREGTGIPAGFGDSEALDWQLDVTDTYSPNPRLSLATTGSLGYSEGENSTDSDQTRRARLTSQLLWRAAELPVRLRADVSAGRRRIESDLAEDRDDDELRGSVNLTYLPTPRWQLGLEGGGRMRGGSVDETSTFQGATVNYSSLAIPLGRFDYTYGAGTGARNITNSRTTNEQLYFGNFLHDLNRRWLFSWGVPVSMGVTLGQEVRGEHSTLLGELGTFVNRLSWNLSSQSSSAQLIVQDTRNWGRNDLWLTTLNLNGVHNRRLSRFSDFVATFNVNLARQSGSAEVRDDEEDDLDFVLTDERDDVQRGEASSLEFTYRHSRVFRVRNLWFQSRLRLSSDSLLVSDFASSSEDGELLWENRLEYFIGKLELRLRTLLIERAAENGDNLLGILSINRRF